MLYVRPDFYDKFGCIADKCRHSCCQGWEIDIDEESLRRFMAIVGSLGEYIRSSIGPEPSPHFVLDKEERCPFLRADGLCRMILELGEDSLCHICREHPRFYNELPDSLEAGLGLCCEEAARLLLEGNGHLSFLSEGEGHGQDALIELREEIYALLRQDDMSLTERTVEALSIFGEGPLLFDAGQLARFMLGLERMDGEWTDMLEALKAFSGELEPGFSALRFCRILEYLIYRHFATAPDEYEALLRLKFCIVSAMLVSALERLGYETGEALRLWSAEIEYSDENVEKFLDYIDTNM